MSADNYYFVAKTADGKYTVSHRFASVYYSDEGHTVESLREWYDACEPGKYVIDEEWICEPPAPLSLHETLEEAVMRAHRFESDQWSEYGVRIQDGLG